MKRLRLLLALPIFFTFIATNNSISRAAKLEKIEKTYSVKQKEILSISLNIDAGKINVHKNDQPDKIFISVQYDEDSDEIDFDFNERKNELYISIDRDRWFKSWDDHRAPQLEVLLPFDVETEFRSKIKAGEIKFDLGALKLTDFQLRNFAGEVEVDFSEPNQVEMEFMDINVKVGETTLRHLNNARFHNAKINSGIGELSIDFSGEGLKSSHAEIDLDIGETTIYLPHDLGVRFDSSTFGFLTQSKIDYEFIKKGRYYYSEQYDSTSKTMDFSISSGIGELRVVYR
jgi:predicted membrane protein